MQVVVVVVDDIAMSCLTVCCATRLAVCRSVPLSLSVCRSACPSLCQSVCPPVTQSFIQSIIVAHTCRHRRRLLLLLLLLVLPAHAPKKTHPQLVADLRCPSRQPVSLSLPAPPPPLAHSHFAEKCSARSHRVRVRVASSCCRFEGCLKSENAR